jgi:hypothetical protein
MAEKEFLQTIIERAMKCVQMRDLRKCCDFACNAIVGDRHVMKQAAEKLRPVVLAKIVSAGRIFFKRLLERNERYLAMPYPLRGKALHIAASELGLVTRVETLKVNVATIKEECELAGARKQMKMHEMQKL